MNSGATGDQPGGRLPGALLAAALLVLLLLLGFQLWLSRADQVSAAENSARNIAAIFEARLEATLRRTDADLRALAGEIPPGALNRAAAPRYAREINARLRDRLFNLQEAMSYRVHDAHGDTLYASDSEGVPHISISGQPCFLALREHPDAGLVFCDVHTGPSFGRQMVAIVRALRDESGNFGGVVHALIELEYYRRQFAALDLGSQGFIALRRSDSHAQVIRWPDLSGEANRVLAPDHPIVRRLSRGDDVVTLHYATADDPVRRIVGIQVMPSYPFYLAVAFGHDEVLVGWRQQAWIVGVSTLLLLGLVGALLFCLWRMRSREAAMLATLTRSEAKYRTLAAMVPVGICHVDTDGRYTYANERHLEITGHRRDELLGQSWWMSFAEGDRERVRQAWLEREDPAGAFVWEYRFVRPDGRPCDVLGEVRTETDSDGGVRGYIIAQTDITPRKEIEAELLAAKQQAESANLAKTRFLAAASHDLRQPIQAINLFRDALARTDLSEEQRAIADLLSVSVGSLGELLYSLLDIAKLDSGVLTAQMQAVDVVALFSSVDAEFSPLALDKGLRFKLFYPFKGMRLMTDSGILLSVLRNLIDNAFKFTETGGVLVGVRRRSGRAIVQVFDTGIGVDSAYGERVFDECFQINNGTRDRSKGLGLGLSIARRMAQLLGGELSFNSRPGVGTVFALSLPLLAQQLPDEASPGAVDASSGVAGAAGTAGTAGEEALAERWRGRQVTVIEDDPMVARSIALALRQTGIEVTVFACAEQALASTISADFYLSDYTLPGLTGLQLLDALAARSTRPIRAALMTGETLPESLALLHAARWRVLVKPVGLSTLLAALGEAL